MRKVGKGHLHGVVLDAFQLLSLESYFRFRAGDIISICHPSLHILRCILSLSFLVLLKVIYAKGEAKMRDVSDHTSIEQSK